MAWKWNPFTQTLDRVAASPAADPNVVLENVACDSSVFVGAVVRMSSGTAVNAKADTEGNANFIGVAIAKPTSTTCHIRITGVTSALYGGLDDTKIYFLSDITDGGITTTPPTASGSVVVRVGNPFSTTRLNVDKGIGIVRD